MRCLVCGARVPSSFCSKWMQVALTNSYCEKSDRWHQGWVSTCAPEAHALIYSTGCPPLYPILGSSTNNYLTTALIQIDADIIIIKIVAQFHESPDIGSALMNSNLRAR
jgi:hypothetical protein